MPVLHPGNSEWVSSERSITKYKTNLGTLRAWSVIYEITPLKHEDGTYSEFYGRCNSRNDCTLCANEGKRSMDLFILMPDPKTMKKFNGWKTIPTKCGCNKTNRARKKDREHAAEVAYLMTQADSAVEFGADIFKIAVVMTI